MFAIVPALTYDRNLYDRIRNVLTKDDLINSRHAVRDDWSTTRYRTDLAGHHRFIENTPLGEKEPQNVICRLAQLGRDTDVR